VARRILIGTPAAFAAALVLASSALSSGTGFITLRAGEELDVVGTPILCQVGSGAKAIACFKVDAHGPLPGSYGIGIKTTGVAAWKIDAARNPKQVYTRKTASAQKRVTIKLGQVARLQGTTLDCAIVRSGAKNDTTVYCSRDDKVGPVVGSYAVLLSKSMAAVGKVKADRSTTIVWLKKH